MTACTTSPPHKPGDICAIFKEKDDWYDEAKDAYGLALEADPANPDVYYNLACIHALTNEKEQALGYLQIALLNGYVDLSTLTQDPDLKSLNGDERFEALKKGELQ